MKLARLFARRNQKEMLRDKLGCFFFLGFPLALLLMFRLIDSYIPAEGIDMFAMPKLLPGIVVFAYTFVMLYTALLVAKDKTTAFLLRLYASPMRTADYIIGYAVPGVVVGILQTAVCFIVANLLLWIDKDSLLSFGIFVKMMIFTLPLLLVFCFLGIFFGACLSDKAAPGIASVFISLTGVLSGAWMPLETMGELERFASYLPFYPAVRIGRHLTFGTPQFPGRDLFVLLGYMVVIFVLALIAFGRMSKRDKK